jgi:hypothetical protein
LFIFNYLKKKGTALMVTRLPTHAVCLFAGMAFRGGKDKAQPTQKHSSLPIKSG